MGLDVDADVASLTSAEIADYVFERTFESLGKCISNRYFIANVIYLFYCGAMLFIDYNAIGVGEVRLQSVYIQFAALHLFVAVLYFHMWEGENKHMFADWFYLLPDWLNLIGSIIYLVSACMYPYQFDSAGFKTEWFHTVQLLELIAVIIEFIAMIGWLIQWYVGYEDDLRDHPSHCISRGFTFDDPDLWANITLVLAATYYLQYALRVFQNFEEYDTCVIYESGDIMYFLNSICYIVCAMRDCGVFWFMPEKGRFPVFEVVARHHYHQLKQDELAKQEMVKSNSGKPLNYSMMQ